MGDFFQAMECVHAGLRSQLLDIFTTVHDFDLNSLFACMHFLTNRGSIRCLIEILTCAFGISYHMLILFSIRRGRYGKVFSITISPNISDLPILSLVIMGSEYLYKSHEI